MILKTSSVEPIIAVSSVSKNIKNNIVGKDKKLKKPSPKKPVNEPTLIGFSSVYQNWGKGTVPNFTEYALYHKIKTRLTKKNKKKENKSLDKIFFSAVLTRPRQVVIKYIWGSSFFVFYFNFLLTFLLYNTKISTAFTKVKNAKNNIIKKPVNEPTLINFFSVYQNWNKRSVPNFTVMSVSETFLNQAWSFI